MTDRAWVRAWAWGFYLATSWTWCIGLFLPVILAADTGPGTWPIFVACNLVGAASLPLLLRTRRAATAFLRRHLMACRVFSVVTILCQSWFLGWVAGRMPAPAAVAALGAVGLLLFAGRSRAVWGAASLLWWAATVGAGAYYLHASPHADLAGTLLQELSWHPAALYALPLVFAGFAFSPYLDLTFQHALRRAPRTAFTVAFPVLFGTVLVVSLAYRDEIGPLLLQPGGPAAAPWLLPLLAVLVAQVGFTLVLHTRHLPVRIQRGTIAAAAAAALLAWSWGDTVLPTGRTLNEMAYRASIGFYGVLAPCWLWSARHGAIPGTAALALTGVALLLAAVPMLLDPGWLFLYPAAFVLMALTRAMPGRPLPRGAGPAAGGTVLPS